jgi:DNA polymerase-4
MDFLHPLPVGALWGVGPKTEEVLLRLGLRTVGDLAHVPAKTLQRALGSAGAHLHELSWGRDPRRVVPNEPEKSAGHEETFSTDIDDPAVIHRELLLLSERTAGRLRSSGWLARTVSIKVRFADFATITRSRTLDVPTDVGQELYDTARALYDALGLERARIRLVGVRAERLIDAGSAPQQLELGAREYGRRDAELAADRAARRFGAGAVRPATLLHRDGRPGSSAGSAARRAGADADPTRPGRPRSRRPVPEAPAGDPG